MIVARVPPVPNRPRSRRLAAAVVEFALIAPFLAVFVGGMSEIGRAIMVREVLNDAVRKGCRKGVLPNRTTTDITNDVTNILNDNSIPTTNVVITILVNGQAVDASTAVKGDQISLKVSVPFADVSWTPPIYLTGYALESVTLVMQREG